MFVSATSGPGESSGGAVACDGTAANGDRASSGDTAASLDRASSGDTAASLERASSGDPAASLDRASSGDPVRGRSPEERTAARQRGTEPAAEARDGVLLTLLGRVTRLSDDELVDESERIAAVLSSAQAELAAVLAEIERRGVHGQWDCPSIERFTGWKCQVAPARAASLGVLGRALTELPALGAAVVRGDLAADKAVAIARVATNESVSALVDLARNATVDQTRRICTAWRRYDTDPAEGDTDEMRRRDEAAIGRVIVIHDETGVELRARFDHVDGALVLSALDAITAQVRAERREARPPDPSPSTTARPASVDEIPLERLDREQWRAQGLRRTLELAVGSTPTTTARNGFRTEVVVHVPVDLLLDPSDVDDLAASERTHGRERHDGFLEPSGRRLRREIARLLVCDSGLHTVLEDGNGDPLHMGRRRSSIGDAQRRAVHARHPHCTWPGCTAAVVQLHHRHHRVAGGHDDIENLVPLCTHHHGVVHRRSILVGRTPDGTLRFLRADGTAIDARDPFGRLDRTIAMDELEELDAPVEALIDRQRRLGIDVDAPLRRSQWMNDRFDLGDAIAAVADRRDAALRRTRPTGAPSG